MIVLSLLVIQLNSVVWGEIKSKLRSIPVLGVEFLPGASAAIKKQERSGWERSVWNFTDDGNQVSIVKKFMTDPNLPS